MRRTFTVAAAALVTLSCALPRRGAEARSAREQLLAAKQLIIEANYRNDRTALRRAVQQLARVESDNSDLPWTLYHEALAEWFLAASFSADRDTTQARAALDLAHASLEKAVRLAPDDGDVHALLTWTITSLVVADPVRAGSLIPEMLAHRKRALELGPDNPRVIMMEAGLLFYAPGGSQDRALARWNEAIRIFERREHARCLPHRCRSGAALSHTAGSQICICRLLRREWTPRVKWRSERCKCDRTSGGCALKCCRELLAEGFRQRPFASASRRLPQFSLSSSLGSCRMADSNVCTWGRSPACQHHTSLSSFSHASDASIDRHTMRAVTGPARGEFAQRAGAFA